MHNQATHHQGVDFPFAEDLVEQIPVELKKAEALRLQGRPDEAFSTITEYLDDNFDDIPALLSAAHLLFEAKKIGLAHAILSRAAWLDQQAKKRVKQRTAIIWNNLGLCYQEGADLEEGEAAFFRSLKHEPNSGTTLNNLAQIYINTGQPEKALKYLERAINLESGLAEARYNKSLSLLMMRDWEEGWNDFDAGLWEGGPRKMRTYANIPVWDGTEGKTIIVYGEQGIGDEISFASMIPDLMKKNKVIIDCDKRLKPLFTRSFGVETHGTRFDESINWLFEPGSQKIRNIDASIAMGSLGKFYRTTEESFPGTPYLVADPQRRIQWRALLDSLGSKPKIGIAWTGGNKNTGKHRRSLELDDLVPILMQDAIFISLQYKPDPKIETFAHARGIKIHHWPHALHTPDYDDTAALVAELDMVVSVTTAVIHLAGSLGVPCWALAPKSPRWFYGLEGKDLPWYKSVKLYRQTGEWVHTISDVAHDLREHLKELPCR